MRICSKFGEPFQPALTKPARLGTLGRAQPPGRPETLSGHHLDSDVEQVDRVLVGGNAGRDDADAALGRDAIARHEGPGLPSRFPDSTGMR